jgi:hypothetical protein
MPVQMDLTRELRTPNALAQLVHYVSQVSATDELDLIEWKEIALPG